MTIRNIRAKVKSEFEKLYPEIDPDIWYQVAYFASVDRIMLGNNQLYFRTKFDIEFDED